MLYILSVSLSIYMYFFFLIARPQAQILMKQMLPTKIPSYRVAWDICKLPKTKTLNLHSATFPVLSEAKYRMLCSPAGNVSPGCFP